MKKLIKRFVLPFVPLFILKPLKELYQKKQLRDWEEAGRPAPPPHIVKRMTIAGYQGKYGYSTLIETGTFMGDMVEAQKNNFKRIISIELSDHLCKRAKNKFRADNNVTIVHGDSGKVLNDVLKNISEPAIFWLDGHYSSGITAKGDTNCPIFGELDAILASNVKNHILLIDDARLFSGDDDYPTIDQVTRYILDRNLNYKVEVKDDIIRYVI